MSPPALWWLREQKVRRRQEVSSRWKAASEHLQWWGPTTDPLVGAAPVVAVHGDTVHLLLLGLEGHLPPGLVSGLGGIPSDPAKDIPLHTETEAALERLCWHLPRWLPVLAEQVPFRAADFRLLSVDSWNPDSRATHRPPQRVSGRSLLLPALLAMVSKLAMRPLPPELAFSADLNFHSGRLSPVEHLHQKRAGLRALLPRVDALLTAPHHNGVPEGVETLSSVTGVLERTGMADALVHAVQLQGQQSGPDAVRSLARNVFAGRSLLYSWTAVARAAGLFLEQEAHSASCRTVLRFVQAVSARHDGHAADLTDLSVDAIHTACQDLGIDVEDDELRAQWTQHHTDQHAAFPDGSEKDLEDRIDVIRAELLAGRPVWPAAIKFLGAWARHRALRDGPKGWEQARNLSILACRSWLRARLGREASFPLSEVWRLTGALPPQEARYAEAVELHERWCRQPGAVTADNHGYVLLSALRALVLAAEEGLETSAWARSVVPKHLRRGQQDLLVAGLHAIANGQIHPDIAHLRAAAERWLLRREGAWSEAAGRRAAEQSPAQAWLARLDHHPDADPGSTPSQIHEVAVLQRIWRHWGCSQSEFLRGVPY